MVKLKEHLSIRPGLAITLMRTQLIQAVQQTLIPSLHQEIKLTARVVGLMMIIGTITATITHTELVASTVFSALPRR
ncbi:MAG: hypothetical protein IBX55_00005 [Methyloprofundus sp.]|nr:hypothetical protein [Methyloprofundus sp.]